MTKVGYLSGPVDARKIYSVWEQGGQTDLFGTSYLQHWFAELDRQGREGLVITSHAGETYTETRGPFTIMNRPKPRETGIAYHVAMARWTRDRLVELENEGVETAVLTDANQFWFASWPFRRRGMRFVNSYHCALRTLAHKRLSPHEALLSLTSRIHLRHGDPTMVISEHIRDELFSEPGSDKRTVLLLRPDYPPARFEASKPPPIAYEKQDTVRVMYAGRVERNKGVFDLLTMAELLAERGGPRISFDIHGVGEASRELADAVARSRHGALITLHGFTPGETLGAHYDKSDIVIVPTRSDFEEGFAKSVVEGLLALRPTVTSRACPSIHTVGDACVEAEVDNPASYADAIWQLACDPALAMEKVKAARQLRQMFFDPPERYDRQLREALAIAEAD